MWTLNIYTGYNKFNDVWFFLIKNKNKQANRKICYIIKVYFKLYYRYL